MLQKYFPILSEINSPLSALVALEFSAAAAEIVINNDISNEVLESLLRNAVKETTAYRKEVETSTSELTAARKAAAKAVKYYRYRAAQAARSARSVSRLARRIKAVRRPVTKALKGLDISICRARAAEAQKALKATTNTYNTAAQAVESAVIQGGDIRVIRSSVAILKASVRELEIAHLNFRFAREMLVIASARHSA